jgi:hypothetical protein
MNHLLHAEGLKLRTVPLPRLMLVPAALGAGLIAFVVVHTAKTEHTAVALSHPRTKRHNRRVTSAMAVLRVSIPSPTASTAHAAPIATDAAIVPNSAMSIDPMGMPLILRLTSPTAIPQIVPSSVMIAL